ncbi:hypothetical protein ACWD4P_13360 [Kitasatospora sp. NPDC002543]
MINGRFLLVGDSARSGGLSKVHKAVDTANSDSGRQFAAIKLLKQRDDEIIKAFLEPDADAVLLTSTTNPNDVQASWIRFRAKDSEPSFEYKYSTTGQYQSTQPWRVPIGIQAISPFTMTEVQAHDLAVKTGHTGAFKPLYLNEPVVQNPRPTYYFCIPSEGRTAAVDTLTGHVTTPWSC